MSKTHSISKTAEPGSRVGLQVPGAGLVLAVASGSEG